MPTETVYFPREQWDWIEAQTDEDTNVSNVLQSLVDERRAEAEV